MNTTNSFLIVLLVLLSFTNCNRKVKQESETLVKTLASIKVNKNELVLNQLEGTWYYKDEPFNGYSQKFYSDSTLAEQIGFYNGKREGIAQTWSPNGTLRTESYYDHNNLNGIYKAWWENGVLSLEVNYSNGLKQGEEKSWYSNGNISKIRNLVDGKELGLQQAWLENGKLYVNYEAKNGRIFGMRRANSCFKLENEKVVKYKVD